MSQLVRHIATYAKQQVCSVLAGAGGQEVRPILRGPTKRILEELLAILGDRRGMEVTVGETTVHVPVFLAADEADSLEGLQSGICSPSHLVKVRNDHNCRCFLTLLPAGVSLNESITTSGIYLGANPNTDHDSASWRRQSFIEDLIEAVLLLLKVPEVDRDSYRRVIDHVLAESSIVDISSIERTREWEVIEELFELVGTGQEQLHQRFLAVMGLPPCDPIATGKDLHFSIVNRVAEHVESHGVTNAFQTWLERAPINLHAALSAVRDHFFGSYRSPSEIAKAPTSYYRIRVNSIQSNGLPAWWTELTVDAWDSLLDAEHLPAKDGIRISVSETVIGDTKGLPFVFQEQCTFVVALKGEAKEPVKVRISRSKGGRLFEQLTEIEASETEQNWSDQAVPDHDKPIRYRFEAPGYKSVSIAALVLNKYMPGVVIYCRNGTKHSLFKKKQSKKRGQSSTRDPITYECDLDLPGIGSHHLDLLYATGMRTGETITGHETSGEQSDKETRPINRSGDHSSACLIETDEESVHEFDAHINDGTHARFQIFVRASETQPIGARSEFDRLILEHRSAVRRQNSTTRVEPASCRASDLQHWILEDAASHYPVILGDDYLGAWARPNWTLFPVLSNAQLQIDPRPSLDSFKPPNDFMAARKALLEILRDGEPHCENLLEEISLADLMRNKRFQDNAIQLISAYSRWLRSDYENAAWSDVIAVSRRESSGSALESYPHAIMLSPLHPLRLGWQLVAQGLLQSSVDSRIRCPAASVLDPRVAPDCMILPCRTPSGKTQSKLYLSVSCSSDYWTVLWGSDRLTELNQGAQPSIFDSDFGITIDGLATGFSVSQVERAIQEVSHILSAKTSLQVTLTSDTHGSSSCNEGIASWARANMGEQDPWASSGGRSLTVMDARPLDLQPHEAQIATLAQEVGDTLRWISRDDSSRSDLAIVAHLGTQNPECTRQDLRSPIDAFGLHRIRTRKQLSASGGRFIAESRVGTHRSESLGPIVR